MNGRVDPGFWSVEIRRDDGCLADLGPDWNDLFARCRTATPFQSHAWLESWWRTYGRPGRLRLVLVRHAGRLVAAAPLMLVRRWSCRVLAPVGGPLSDFTDVLVDDDVAAEASRLLVETLILAPGWQAIDFAETRQGAAVGRWVAGAWPGPYWKLPAALCLELPAMPMAALVRELPSHTRKTVRRRLNQLGRLDLEIRAATSVEADRAVADLVRLHAMQWQGRGGNAAHLRPEFRRHLAGAVRGMIEADQAVLLEYRISGQLMASSLVVVGRDLVGGYLYGADPQLRDQVDVTTMLLADTLPMAHRLGCSTMSMLRGAEAHKMRWRPREAVNERVLLARPGSLRAVTYAARIRIGRRAVRSVGTRLPWLRNVARAARRTASRIVAIRPAGPRR